MKNASLKTHFRRAYWLVAKGLAYILGPALAIHFVLENEVLHTFAKYLFHTGALMLIGGMIVTGICRHIILISKGKEMERAEKLARENGNFLKNKNVAKAHEVLQETKTQKQHELYVRRMFREIS